jgi:purine-binding chemotaxis protein CheW
MSFDIADFTYSRQRGLMQATPQSVYFVVGVGAHRVGLPVECVKTVFHIDKLTLVPLAPPEVAGLANLRGRIVTALNLDVCLGVAGARPPKGAMRLAVDVESGGENYALIIDETGDVIASAESDKVACPAHIAPQLSELLGAFYRVGDDFLSILDLDALIRRVARQSETALVGGSAQSRINGA